MRCFTRREHIDECSVFTDKRSYNEVITKYKRGTSFVVNCDESATI